MRNRIFQGNRVFQKSVESKLLKRPERHPLQKITHYIDDENQETQDGSIMEWL